MFFEDFLNTIDGYFDYFVNFPEILTELVNQKFADHFRANRVDNIALLPPEVKLLVNVMGKLNADKKDVEFVNFYDSFFVLDLYHLKKSKKSQRVQAEALRQALEQYQFEGDGKFVWFIPDGFMASLTEIERERDRTGEGYFSHESICVLNTSEIDTRCQLEVFYENDPEENNFECEFEVKAKQSLHYRLDKLKDDNGNPLIRKDSPVSYKITSYDARVVVQGSRILTSGEDSEFASFGTVMGW